MVSNLFKKVKMVCKAHPDAELICDSENGRNLVFYKCLHCDNQITMLEYEAMIDKLDHFLVKENSLSFGSFTNLTGRAWSNTKGVHYKIKNHDLVTGNILVEIDNSISRQKQNVK